MLIMVFIVKSKHIYLNLFLIDFPITAIASIVHRITGLVLFIFIPLILYFFKLSIESESSYILIVSLINKLYIRVFLSVILFSFFYHLIFGIKHIVMDLGFFDGKVSGKNFTIFSLIIFLFLVFLSVLIW